jgi:hypothetical protein
MHTPDSQHRPESDEGLRDAQERAAASARTVGAFVEDFRAQARELVKDGAADEARADERLRTVEAAAKGSENLKLADLEANVLGQATVGGGDGGVQLSRDVFANAEGSADVERARHVAAHERAHGEQAELSGTLVVDGEEVDHLLLLEGDAELAGNEAVGRSEGHHREGQPEETYAEGQELLVNLERRVAGGRAKIRGVLRGSGNLRELQEALAA